MKEKQEWTWPNYTRGKDAYQWVLSPAGLARGLTYLGSAARLRRAVSKLMTGQPCTIAAVGGEQQCLGEAGWLGAFSSFPS